MSKTPRILDIEKVIHNNKVKTDFIAAPFTQIVNEQGDARRIPDLSNNLKPSFGIERIITNNISKVEKEFGPGGEIVWETFNKDSRIRFVGNDWSTEVSNVGTRIRTANIDDFVEITFYGTGLNILTRLDEGPRDYRVSVDGGPEGANVYGSPYDDIINDRNYRVNQILPIVKGLALGIHTVKIRLQATNFEFFGFEVANESAQITVNAGQPFVGGFSSKVNSQQFLDAKPSGLTGDKGGRVVVYLDEEGNTNQATTPVDVNSLFLGSSDHSNEEVIRKANFKEFGRNRSDDFSSISGNTNDNRGYTLDDGTTTLVGEDCGEYVVDGVSGLGWSGTSEYILTFVGTGLDILDATLSNTGPNLDITIDGTLVGQLAQLPGVKKRQICSGLPYGTHTVSFSIGTPSPNDWIISDFIVYGPKKPQLPESAVEIADYNVVADFVANTVANARNTSTGVIRKQNIREFVYSGGVWSTNGIFPDTEVSGFNIFSTANGAYFEYTFFGTGFDLRFDSEGTNIFSIDGSTDFSSYTTNHYGVGTWNPSTGTITGNLTPSSGLVVQGLPLGVHTIRGTLSSAGVITPESLDVIVPIHINSDGFKETHSLKDLRNDSQLENSSYKVDLTKPKVLLSYDAVAQQVRSSYNVSSVIQISLTQIIVYFKNKFKDEQPITLATGSSTGVLRVVGISDGSGQSSKEIGVNIISTANTNIYNLAIYGELENEEDIDLEDL